jgi:hypothetical protein
MLRQIRFGFLCAVASVSACGGGSTTNPDNTGAGDIPGSSTHNPTVIQTVGSLDTVVSVGNSSGDLMAVWRDYAVEGGQNALRFTMFNPGIGWTGVQTVLGSPRVEKERVNAALDVKLNSVIAWFSKDSVMAAYVTNGVIIHTQEIESIGGALEFNPTGPRVVADSNGSGRFAIAWLAGDVNNKRINVARCDATAGCLLQSTPSKLRKSDQAELDAHNLTKGAQKKGVVNVTSFDLAFDGASNVIAVWNGEARYSLELEDGHFVTGGYNGLNISRMPLEAPIAQWSDPINLIANSKNSAADIDVNLAIQGDSGVVAIGDGELVELSNLIGTVPIVTPISVELTKYEHLESTQRFRMLTMDENGGAWHLWRCDSDGSVILELCAGRYEVGQWQFSSIAEPHNATVAASANAKGDVIVIWETSQSYRARTYSSDQKAWSTPFDVDQEALFGPTALSVALSNDGVWHAVWMRTHVDENNNDPLTRFQEKLFSKRGQIQ